LLEVGGEAACAILDPSKMAERNHALLGKTPDIEIVASVDARENSDGSPCGDTLSTVLSRCPIFIAHRMMSRPRYRRTMRR